jgi:brefeldin A-inhibited guanine nucleotide-exchange protein
VLSRVHNVKSGWKIVWSVFEESARDSSVAAAQLTLQTASRLLNEYCDVIMKGGQNETPIEVVQCLIAFVESRLVFLL